MNGFWRYLHVVELCGLLLAPFHVKVIQQGNIYLHSANFCIFKYNWTHISAKQECLRIVSPVILGNMFCWWACIIMLSSLLERFAWTRYSIALRMDWVFGSYFWAGFRLLQYSGILELSLLQATYIFMHVGSPLLYDLVKLDESALSFLNFCF